MPNEPLRLLALGAHPDDIEFGCGGVLLVEAARASEIALLVCSRGEAGSHGAPNEREDEARKAANLLGASLRFLEMGGDCHLEASSVNQIALARQIRLTRPDVLLSPTGVSDQHPDHVVVSQMARQAARLARYGGLAELRDLPAFAIGHHLEYAITPGAEPPNERPRIRVDLSDHLERWRELMECHASQLRTRRYVELQMARARLLGLGAGVEYAQALWTTDDLLVRNLFELPRSVRLF